MRVALIDVKIRGINTELYLVVNGKGSWFKLGASREGVAAISYDPVSGKGVVSVQNRPTILKLEPIYNEPQPPQG